MASPAKVACAMCELHAEAVFRVEGMDCNEEVVILERRLKPLAGLEAISADVDRPAAARQIRRRQADDVGHGRCRRPDRACGCGSSTRSRVRPGADVRARWRLMVGSRCRPSPPGSPLSRAARRTRLPRAASPSARSSGGVFPARRAVTALRSRTLDINVLMVVAVAGALALGEWLEAASVVFLFAVAQWLEVRTLERARQAIRALDRSVAARGARQARRRRAPRCRSRRSRSATRSSCGRATRCRSTASSSPATATSTKRRSPASRCRWTRRLATRSSPGTINGRGALDLRVTRHRARHAAGADHPPGRRRRRRSRAPVQSFVDRFARDLHAGRHRARGRSSRSCRRSSRAPTRPRGCIGRWCCSSFPARARWSSRRRSRSCRRCRRRRGTAC